MDIKFIAFLFLYTFVNIIFKKLIITEALLFLFAPLIYSKDNNTRQGHFKTNTNDTFDVSLKTLATLKII